MERAIPALRRGLFCAAVAAACLPLPPASAQVRHAVDLDPLGVVERSIAAYNRRDADAFAALFAEDATLFNFPDQPQVSGRAAIRAAFAGVFERSAGVRIEVVNRMVHGRYVVVHGRTTGVAAEVGSGVGIYEVGEGGIHRLWLMEEGGSATGWPAVSMPGTELRAVQSSSTARAYDIQVMLPGGYAQDTDTKYPVVYVLDGQWDFKLVASIQGGLVYDGHIPPAIVVGVTYSGADADYGALRAMDYTPVATAGVAGSGDGAKFLAFLKTELLPLIEASYRVDATRRVLMGSSYGGLFTLYALFSEPGLFSAYIAGSPAVPYADRYVTRQEAEYASRRRELPARLFVAVGAEEGLAGPVRQFVQTVSARNYSGLTLDSLVVRGEGHSSNKPEAFNRGLRFALPR